MKKRTAKLTALALAAMMALAGCGGGGSTSGSGESGSSEELKDLYTWETQAREVESLNVLKNWQKSWKGNRLSYRCGWGTEEEPLVPFQQKKLPQKQRSSLDMN